jgi:ubiquitin C-terminal hydrolase
MKEYQNENYQKSNGINQIRPKTSINKNQYQLKNNSNSKDSSKLANSNKCFMNEVKQSNNFYSHKNNSYQDRVERKKSNKHQELNKNQDEFIINEPLEKSKKNVKIFFQEINKNQNDNQQIFNQQIFNQQNKKKNRETPTGNELKPPLIIQNKNKNPNSKKGYSKSYIIKDINITAFINPPLIIIENNGNTSYINVILQIFGNIKNIKNYYLTKKDDFFMKKNELLLSCKLSQIIEDLFLRQKNGQYPDYISIPLKPFHELIVQINPIFKGKSTKNVIDFLVFFIDKLHDEDKLMHVENYSKKDLKNINNENFGDYIKYLIHNENSIIFETFSWINKKVEECWQCKNQSIKFQKYFTYDLDFEYSFNKKIYNNEKELSIMDCIIYTNENKNIYNIFCYHCNKKNNFTVSSSIHLSQSVFILLLREIENSELVKKMMNNNIKITINEYLDLSNLVENKSSYMKYTLHAIVFYDTIKKEYIAYSISPIDKNWYKYTNGKIEPAKFKYFADSFDYTILPVILFYRHI